MKNKTYPNQYAYFIRRILKNRGLTVYGFSKDAKISNGTFYAIANNKSKYIKHSTMIQLIQDLGYYDLKYFVECFEQFEKYGIIVNPRPAADFTPLEVTTFCMIVIFVMALMYFLLR